MDLGNQDHQTKRFCNVIVSTYIIAGDNINLLVQGSQEKDIDLAPLPYFAAEIQAAALL